jgi:hypothetical protein
MTRFMVSPQSPEIGGCGRLTPRTELLSRTSGVGADLAGRKTFVTNPDSAKRPFASVTRGTVRGTTTRHERTVAARTAARRDEGRPRGTGGLNRQRESP